MFRGPHLHQPAATQEAAGHVADHGANGPEVVLAAGVAPSRRRAQQWYGLVVGVAWSLSAMSPPGWLSMLRPSYTLEVFAARRSAQTPRGVSSVTGDAATHKSAPEPRIPRRARHDQQARQEGGLPVVRRRRRAPRRAPDCSGTDTLSEGFAGQPPAASGDTFLLMHAAYTATDSAPS